MKSGVVIGGGFALALLASAASLANMNTINLLLTNSVFQSDTGADVASNMENFDVTEEAKEAGLKDDQYGFGAGGLSADGQWMQIIEEVTIGGGGGGGGGLNLMWLLQNLKDPDKNSYAYQLLEVYSKLENGAYNDNKYHVPPSALAGSHYNETKLASFAVPSTSGVGQGSMPSGVRLEDTTKAHAVGSGGAVWKDANDDGGPDGPFQIEERDKPDSNASKIRGDGKYDLYSFVDAANVIDSKFSELNTALVDHGVNLSRRELAVLFGLIHNRGEAGATWMLAGIPYNATGITKGSHWLKSSTYAGMTAEQAKAVSSFASTFLTWYDSYNIPLEKIYQSTEQTRGLAALIILSKGGFFNSSVSAATAKAFRALPDDIVNKVFPGHTGDSVIELVNSKYVKKPWDALGIDRGSFNKIYGGSLFNNQYEEIYRFDKNWYNTSFYVENVTTDLYKGGSGKVLRAMEGIATGYMIDVGIAGEYVLLQLALASGSTTLLSGATIDPSNPANLYQGVSGTGGSGGLTTKKVVRWVRVNGGTGGAQTQQQTAVVDKPISYNPAAAGVDGNYAQFLQELNLYGKLTKAQLGMIETVYDIAGGPYGQRNPPRNSKTKDGRLVTDCSLWASFAFFMDNSKDRGWNTSGIKTSAIPLVSTKQTKPYRGTVWNAKAVQVDSTGRSMAPSRSFNFDHSMRDYEWVEFLKTGDMANGNSGSGHVWIYLTQNNTQKNIVIPVEVSKSMPDHSTYKPGQHISYESSGYLLYRGNKMGLQPKGLPYSKDDTTKSYQAFRAVYLPQYR